MKVFPINVCLITLNEEEHLRKLLPLLVGRVAQITVVDSLSTDHTVDLCLAAGVKVVQRKFTDFGDQWNFAIGLPTDQPWTMKLDPDERISDELWESMGKVVEDEGAANGYSVERRLWWMGKPLRASQIIMRLWRTGTCKFTEVLVNEHPVVEGENGLVKGYLEHLDSRDLSHWVEKQDHYTTLEAITAVEERSLAAKPKLLGSGFERRMWLKKNLRLIPFRFQLMWIYELFRSGAWRDGAEGRAWVALRVWVYRLIEYKVREMKRIGVPEKAPVRKRGEPDLRVPQY